MKDTWKKQRLGDDYVFGMVYKWTNKETGRSYVGRTQRVRGTHYYRPLSSMSIRFQEELEKAFYTDKDELKRAKNQFYYDMRVIYDKAGRGQAGMDAIRDSFELEIVEIQLLGEDFDKDTVIIKSLEDYWIDKLRGQGEDLYNVAGGKWGATASYEGSGYGRRDIEERVIYLLRHGFNGVEIADYLGISISIASGIIKDATGMTNVPARLYYTGERMFELIDDGIFDLDELATHFRGMDTNDIMVALASEYFPLGNKYLKGWLTAKFLQLGGETHLLEGYLMDLGISLNSIKYSGGTFYNFRKQEALYKDYERRDYIPLLKFYATALIKDCNTDIELLRQLGLLNLFPEELSAWERHMLIVDLFGWNFDTAKDIYKDHYFGHLQIIIS
jgi:hypothetical protein